MSMRGMDDMTMPGEMMPMPPGMGDMDDAAAAQLAEHLARADADDGEGPQGDAPSPLVSELRARARARARRGEAADQE